MEPDSTIAHVFELLTIMEVIKEEEPYRIMVVRLLVFCNKLIGISGR